MIFKKNGEYVLNERKNIENVSKDIQRIFLRLGKKRAVSGIYLKGIVKSETEIKISS